jgi:hypothetical protein
MEIIVTGEIIFRLSGFESVVCMERDVRELGRPYLLLSREKVNIIWYARTETRKGKLGHNLT